VIDATQFQELIASYLTHSPTLAGESGATVIMALWTVYLFIGSYYFYLFIGSCYFYLFIGCYFYLFICLWWFISNESH
jgi:hypothetical protein